MQVVTVPEESMTVLEIKPENVFSFPEGIPAFESAKEFVILRNPEEAPFMWLQATGGEDLAFIVTMPAVFHPSYVVELSESDVKTLDLGCPGEALVLAIVTVRRGNPATITANLAGPIIINSRTRVGKQVVPLNASKFSVRYDILRELTRLQEDGLQSPREGR